MKSKLGLAAIAVIITVGASVSYYNQAEKPVHSDLLIANIEALTYDEWGFDHGCVNNGDGCMVRINEWHPYYLPLDM